MSECQRQHSPGVRLLNLQRFTLTGLEVARVARVQGQIDPEERLLRHQSDDAAHFLDGLGHLSQRGQTQGEVIVRRHVGRIARDQVAVFLDALLIVAGQEVEQPARRVTLTLRHPIEMPQCLVDVLVGILHVPEVLRQSRQRLVSDAKLRIELNGFGVVGSRFFQLVVGCGFPRRSIVPNHVQRRGRHARHREQLSGVGRLVAERLPHRRHQLRRNADDLIFVGSAAFGRRDDLAGDCLGGFDRDFEATAAETINRSR